MNTSTRLGDKLLEWIARLWEWFSTIPFIQSWLMGRDRIMQMVQVLPDKPHIKLVETLKSLPIPGAQAFGIIIASLTEQAGIPVKAGSAQIITEIIKDPTNYTAGIRRAFEENPPIDFAVMELGKLVVDTCLKPITALLEQERQDPEEALYLIEGRIIATIAGVNAFGILAEIVGIGQIQSVAMMLNKIIDGLALNEISNAILEPLMSNGYRAVTTRFYNKRFRPHRFSATDLLSFYLRRKITKERFYKEMGELGYRDEDSDIALDVADTDIRVNDVFQAYNLNMIDKTETASLLYERGYSPYGVDFLIRLEDEQKRQNDLNAISGVALQAFKKGILSENEYRQMRINAHVPRERIDIEVQLARLQTQTEKSDLSVSNIRGAYMNNVIARKEADTYLQEIGIDAVARQLMLDTWQEQKAPKVLRLNSSTVLSAYATGVLDRNQTIDKLKGIGWSGGDAELQVRIYDLRVTSTPRKLSEGAILTAYHNGIIDTNEAITRLLELNYSPEDAALILTMADLKPVSAAKHLTESHITKLYQLGIFEFVDAITELVNIGYDEDTAQLVLIAQTTKVPKADTLTQ